MVSLPRPLYLWYLYEPHGPRLAGHTCRMQADMIIDPWKLTEIRYRFETFCYGRKSCALYRAGPTRKVPGRRGVTWVEEDWVDEEATAHRAADE